MLHGTHLVQRMRGPRPVMEGIGGVKAHHVFGSTGLGPEGWKVLDPICTLDYMGAAEYEYGKVPNAFHNFALISQRKELRSFAITLAPHERELNWARRHPRKGEVLTPAQTVIVYGICHVDWVELVKDRIRIFATRESSVNVKRGMNFVQNLDPISTYEIEDPVVGWFEMDNLFLFFSQRSVWEGYCNLFEVPMCEVPTPPTTVDYKALKMPDLLTVAVRLGIVPNESRARKLGKEALLKAIQGTL